MIGTRIAGLGHYLPERVVTNFELEKLVATSDQWIRDRTGIVERHVAAPHETSSSLALHASTMALEDARINPEDIDLIIVATTTPDGMFPATASLVQDGLGAANAGAYDVNAACMGFLSALSAATQYIATGAYKRVLVVGTEVLSRILNWQDRGTCVLFGDGAGAVCSKRRSSAARSASSSTATARRSSRSTPKARAARATQTATARRRTSA